MNIAIRRKEFQQLPAKENAALLIYTGRSAIKFLFPTIPQKQKMKRTCSAGDGKTFSPRRRNGSQQLKGQPL